MKLLDQLALLILILAGLHFAAVGLLDFNVVELIFGTTEGTGPMILYGIVGISTLWCTKYFTYTPEGGSRLRDR